MTTFAVAFGFSPRDFDEIYIDEIWPLLEQMEAGASDSPEGKDSKLRKVGKQAVNWLFGK